MPNLMTAAEVASRLEMPRREVLRLVDRGRLHPAMKLDGLRGAYLFDPANVDALADELATPAPETTDEVAR